MRPRKIVGRTSKLASEHLARGGKVQYRRPHHRADGTLVDRIEVHTREGVIEIQEVPHVPGLERETFELIGA
jgi:hypothetical protein